MKRDFGDLQVPLASNLS